VPLRLGRENASAVAAAIVGALLVLGGLFLQIDSSGLPVHARPVAAIGEDETFDPSPEAEVSVGETDPPASSPEATATPTVESTATAALALRAVEPPTRTATSTAVPTVPPTPVPSPTRAFASAAPGAGVPILMYHYIRVNPDPNDQIGYGLSVTPEAFKAEMEFLAARGYRAIAMRDLEPYVATGRTPPEKTVVLTFDDGYRDFYTEAFPLLKKLGFGATLYMITDLIDNNRYLTADMLRELSAAGIEVGSHSASHADMPSLRPDRLRHELVDSRAILEGIVGRPVVAFCYPSGRYSASVRQAVQAAGYTTSVTVEPGIFHGKEERFTIPRVRIYGGMGLGQYARSLGESPPDAARWPGQIADVPYRRGR
jgi:peptidoglycan/xylan/chitin deacetylase (PgdA/CDA1 family)